MSNILLFIIYGILASSFGTTLSCLVELIARRKRDIQSSKTVIAVGLVADSAPIALLMSMLVYKFVDSFSGYHYFNSVAWSVENEAASSRYYGIIRYFSIVVFLAVITLFIVAAVKDHKARGKNKVSSFSKVLRTIPCGLYLAAFSCALLCAVCFLIMKIFVPVFEVYFSVWILLFAIIALPVYTAFPLLVLLCDKRLAFAGESFSKAEELPQDPAVMLAALERHLQNGEITQEEYNAARARILSRL